MTAILEHHHLMGKYGKYMENIWTYGHFAPHDDPTAVDKHWSVENMNLSPGCSSG